MMKILIIILLTLNIWASSDIDYTTIKNLKNHGVKIAIGNGEITSIPNEMINNPKEFLSISVLDFNGINLSSGLPEWLGRLTKLNTLNLQGVDTSLHEIEKLKSLRDLTELNLDDNPNFFKNRQTSKDLSQILMNFPNLVILSLSNTNGRFVDYLAIGNSLPKLTKLNLSSNNISVNLNKLYLSSLNNLKELDLSNNSFRRFNVSSLPMTLQRLDLSNTNLKFFNYPSGISSDEVFPVLTFLDLSGNDSLKIDSKYKSATVMKMMKNGLGKVSPNSLKSKFGVKKISSTTNIKSKDNAENSKVIQEFLALAFLAMLDNMNNVNIPKNKCSLTVASRKSLSEVRKFIREEIDGSFFDKSKIKVFLGAGGWYAISLGLINKENKYNVLSTLKEQGLIPDDSICSEGKDYTKEIYNF